MYVFTKVGKSNLSCFTDCTKHASAGALIHRQQTIYWIFTQTKLSSIYRSKLYCHLLGLDKASSVVYNLGETQTCNYFVLPGAIIGDGDRKSWDPRAPMIWDNFSIFRTNCAILTSYIRADPRTCRGLSRGCCHVA